jgi:hypothetical protein
MGILSGGNGNGARDLIVNQSTQIGRDADGDDTVRKIDLDKMRKQLQADANRRNSLQDARELGLKGFNAVRHGFSDMARSLNTPQSSRRPAIANIGVKGAHEMKMKSGSINGLKHPSLRNRDIRGKRIESKSNDNNNDIEIIHF